jgi:hypothetical protein
MTREGADLFDVCPNRPGYVRDSKNSRAKANSFDDSDLARQKRLILRFARRRDGLTCDEIEVALGFRHQTAKRARVRELVLTGSWSTPATTYHTWRSAGAHLREIGGRMITNRDKFECVVRELGYRYRVYGRLVARGSMSQAQRNHEIEVMEAIVADYRELVSVEQPDLFAEAAREARHER